VHMLGYFDFWNMQETMTADAAVDRTHRNITCTKTGMEEGENV